MAIDTRNKRDSFLDMLPIPDGTVDQGDRQQFLGSYPGILWAVTSITGAAFDWPEIPETGDTGWDDDVTSLYSKMCDYFDPLIANENGGTTWPSASTVVEDMGDLFVTKNHHVLSASGPITLNAVRPGSRFNETVVLQGSSATNTITLSGTMSYSSLNGDIVLADGDAIMLLYDDDRGKWLELFRSN